MKKGSLVVCIDNMDSNKNLVRNKIYELACDWDRSDACVDLVDLGKWYKKRFQPAKSYMVLQLLNELNGTEGGIDS